MSWRVRALGTFGGMFKWFSKHAKRAGFRTAAGQMQTEAVGRLPQDLAEGGRASEPSPEYIAEAAEPSEDVWAHEQDLYRLKREQDENRS
jgi:hypothetical protein